MAVTSQHKVALFLLVCVVCGILSALSYLELEGHRQRENRTPHHIIVRSSLPQPCPSAFSTATQVKWDELIESVKAVPAPAKSLQRLGGFPHMCKKSFPVVLRTSGVEEKVPKVFKEKGSDAASQYILNGEGWYDVGRQIVRHQPNWFMFANEESRTKQEWSTPPVVTPKHIDIKREWPVQSQQGIDHGGWSISWDGSSQRLPNVILPSPPLWFIGVKNAYIFDFSVATCSHILSSGGCVVPKIGFIPTASHKKGLVFCFLSFFLLLYHANHSLYPTSCFIL
eukprot:TRINITY_DN1863_c0_g1_i1.p1 TRINITY_DN1863_c0_g1~~TRINITY_DN1863_c0_g1_i1.p1  ORF type:complete len:282 (+),score=42.74 TRINITY_DN1863_c0_g1_i1:70-915(+)